MKIIKYTEARLSLRKVLDQVVESNEPTCIVSKSSQVVIVSKSEYDRLIKTCAESKHPHLKSAVRFSLETACRQGEMLKAKREHVNWKRRTLWFYDTKNGTDRKIALSETAYSILLSLPEREDGKLFPFKNRDELNWYWLRALKDAGIKDFVYHDLRRTGCTWMFEYKNLQVPQVQLMSGHRDPRVLLRIYTNLISEKLVAQLG